MEESGIEISVGEVFCIASNTAKHPGHSGVKEVPTKLMLDFICEAGGGKARPSEENSETQWVKKEEVLSRITSPSIIERYKAYLEYSQRPVYMEYITQPSFELKLKTTI